MVDNSWDKIAYHGEGTPPAQEIRALRDKLLAIKAEMDRRCGACAFTPSKDCETLCDAAWLRAHFYAEE